MVILHMVEESSTEEGEFRPSMEGGEFRSSSSLFGPRATTSISEEEMVSNLVQFLKACPCRHAMGGLIKGVLEELGHYNWGTSEAFFKSAAQSGTATIQIFGGDASHWTTLCAVVGNDIHELTNLCQPIACDPGMFDKIVKWKAELENLKNLEQQELNMRHCIMNQRLFRDNLIEELYEKTAITIDRNGCAEQKIQNHEAALEEMDKELNEVVSKRKEVSEQCERLRQSVMHSDSGRLLRDKTAHVMYGHICATLKRLLETLQEEPTVWQKCGCFWFAKL